MGGKMNAPIPPRRSQGQWCANCRLFLPELPQAFGQTATLVKTVAPTEVDAFLAIDPRGVVTVESGKVDLGTGVRTALSQIVAEDAGCAIAFCQHH